MGDSRHFVTGDFTSRGTYLNNVGYASVLDNIVVTCVDCVIRNEKGEVLLARRNYEPQPDWWIPGGRMCPGESFETAAARHTQRELGLDIGPARFTYLETYSYVWGRRAQPPQDNGCHMVAIVMRLQITDHEAALINPNEEFSALKWMKPEEIIISQTFHPAITQIAKDLINH